MASHALGANMVLGLPLVSNTTDVCGNTINVGGNPTYSSAQQKFGNNTMLFDGAGDYLSPADGPTWSFGTDDFYCGAHFCPTVDGSNLYLFNLGTYASNGWSLQRATGGSLYLTVNNSSIIVSGSSGVYLGLNTWTHVAVSRVKNVWKLLINGVQVGSSVTRSDNFTLQTFAICTETTRRDTTSQYKFTGYVSDVQVIRGGGPYSETTLPTSAQFLPIGHLEGTTLNASGAAVSATVRAYDSATGVLVSSGISNGGTGAFSIASNGDVAHDVVCDFGSTENKQIFSAVTPV